MSKYTIIYMTFIRMSSLQINTYVWIAMLYLYLVCKYFCYTVICLILLWLLRLFLLFPNLISDLLYLFLVCNFIPTSVMSNSGLFNFTGYGIVRYTVFRAPS